MTATMPMKTIDEIPFTDEARDRLPLFDEADVIATYQHPQIKSPTPEGGNKFFIRDSLLLVVNPMGIVIHVGLRQEPDEDDKAACADAAKAATAPGRPNGGAASGRKAGRPSGRTKTAKGGRRHPTTRAELLERCKAWKLIVEETEKGAHWKITRPKHWKVPSTAVSGSVFVSSTDAPHLLATNVTRIRRETGVDVREEPVDKARLARRAKAAAAQTTAAAAPAPFTPSTVKPEPAAEPEAAVITTPAEPAEKPAAEPEAARHPVTDSIDDRLRFVTEMRREGCRDWEIAEAMGTTGNGLAAFLTTQRKRGNPLTPPPRKRYTDPVTGVVTQPGVTVVDRRPRAGRPTWQPPVAGQTRPDQVEAVETWLAEHGEETPLTAAEVATPADDQAPPTDAWTLAAAPEPAQDAPAADGGQEDTPQTAQAISEPVSGPEFGPLAARLARLSTGHDLPEPPVRPDWIPKGPRTPPKFAGLHDRLAAHSAQAVRLGDTKWTDAELAALRAEPTPPTAPELDEGTAALILAGALSTSKPEWTPKGQVTAMLRNLAKAGWTIRLERAPQTAETDDEG